MKGFMKSISAALISAVMVAAIAFPASAAGTNYTPVSAQDATFSKYLIVDNGATAPDTTFTYSISSADVTEQAATAANGTTPGTLRVYKGTGTPTIAPVSFSKSDTAETSTLVTDYKTYKKTITINMSSVTFSEPGVYRYYIEEADSTLGGMYCDVDYTTPALTTEGSRFRTLDVYVEDASTETATGTTKELKITGYIMYEGKVTAAPSSSSSASSGTAITDTKAIEVNAANGAEVVEGGNAVPKSDRYVNYYTSQSLTFGKVVTGNQGSRDKYFKFTLKLNSPSTATVSVDVSHADGTVAAGVNSATTVSGTNVTSIDLTAGTVVSTDFYLQHGQYIIVNGLPVGTTYELTEDAEGYESTAGITQAVSVINWDGVAGNDALSDSITGTIAIDDKDATTTGDGDIHTGFTNDKQGIIPTGVLMTMTPVVVIAVIAVAGVAFFAVRGAKRKAVELAEADAEESEAE